MRLFNIFASNFSTIESSYFSVLQLRGETRAQPVLASPRVAERVQSRRGTLAMAKIDKSCMQLFIVPRNIRDTRTFLNVTPGRFSRARADTCPRFQHAQRGAVSHCLLRAIARVSQKHGYLTHVSFRPVDAFASYRRRDMQESYSRPPFNLPRSIRGDVSKGERGAEKSSEKGSSPGIHLIFQKRHGG